MSIDPSRMKSHPSVFSGKSLLLTRLWTFSSLLSGWNSPRPSCKGSIVRTSLFSFSVPELPPFSLNRKNFSSFVRSYRLISSTMSRIFVELLAIYPEPPGLFLKPKLRVLLSFGDFSERTPSSNRIFLIGPFKFFFTKRLLFILQMSKSVNIIMDSYFF